MQNGTATLENELAGVFFIKLNRHLYMTAIPVLGIRPEDMKTYVYTITRACPQNRDNICQSHNWQGTGHQAT